MANHKSKYPQFELYSNPKVKIRRCPICQGVLGFGELHQVYSKNYKPNIHTVDQCDAEIARRIMEA